MTRRPDPLEESARDLAVAAGLDPNARVGEGRGMPVWCTAAMAGKSDIIFA
jgi:tRNA-splicing ligase RtcB